MLKRIVLLIVFVTTLGNVYAQQSVNNYKYVIVPNMYDFQHNPDEYQLNSLSQFLFNKYGFTAIMQGDEFPEDLQKNGCLALRADVVKDKGMFLTKLHVVLKNCKDQIIFEGPNGESREKKYKVAYNKALREAFLYVKELNYSYKPLESNNQKIDDVQDVKPVKPEAVTAENTVKKTDITVPIKKTVSNTSEVLYAQPINNGYQLVDSTPKIIYTLIFTGKKDFFMVKGKDATVYKQNDNWVIAETVGDDLQVKVLDIKF